METNKDNLIGKVLKNKYRIEKRIGNGGQGKIYRSTDLSVNIKRQYAVKQFTPNYNDDFLLEVGKRFFNQESKILQKLGKHSQIPQIFDYFEIDKQFYLVQELIEGENLEQEFAQKKQLTELELLPILKDILDVLNFVHNNNYIHRDIKPSNLIRNKSDLKIYLIDFGTVKEKIKSSNIDSQGNSVLTVAAGTNGYMPNEQRLGRPKFCSDIYAVGMVAINALTGVDPKQIHKDEQDNPIWKHHLPVGYKQYNPNLMEMLDRMVKGDRQERYQSVNVILADWQKLDNTIVADNSSDLNSAITEDNPTKKKSFLPWLGLGMGTIALGIVGFSFTTTDKYTVYENAENNLTIEHPEKWQVQENWRNFQEPGVTFLSPLESDRDQFRERVTITVEKLSQPLSLNEYTADSIKQIETNNEIIEPATSTIFANKEDRKVIYQEKGGNKKRLEFWTIKNQKVYIATYSAKVNKFDKYLKQAENAIASIAVNDS